MIYSRVTATQSKPPRYLNIQAARAVDRPKRVPKIDLSGEKRNAAGNQQSIIILSRIL
jgi:hypothetical protein